MPNSTSKNLANTLGTNITVEYINYYREMYDDESLENSEKDEGNIGKSELSSTLKKDSVVSILEHTQREYKLDKKVVCLNFRHTTIFRDGEQL